MSVPSLSAFFGTDLEQFERSKLWSRNLARACALGGWSIIDGGTVAFVPDPGTGIFGSLRSVAASSGKLHADLIYKPSGNGNLQNNIPGEPWDHFSIEMWVTKPYDSIVEWQPLQVRAQPNGLLFDTAGFDPYDDLVYPQKYNEGFASFSGAANALGTWFFRRGRYSIDWSVTLSEACPSIGSWIWTDDYVYDRTGGVRLSLRVQERHPHFGFYSPEGMISPWMATHVASAFPISPTGPANTAGTYTCSGFFDIPGPTSHQRITNNKLNKEQGEANNSPFRYADWCYTEVQVGVVMPCDILSSFNPPFTYPTANDGDVLATTEVVIRRTIDE